MNITAIYGKNASGKTLYVERMRRRLASDSVRYIAFRDSYGPAVDQAYYLQLRWNQHDIDAETPNVGELLERTFLQTGDDTAERRQWQEHVYALLGMTTQLNKFIIALSSGELRRFQLAKTLLAKPRTLIIDNPFIGLDSEGRQMLSELLRTLAETHELEIFLVVSRLSDIPDYVCHVEHCPPCDDDSSASASGSHLSASDIPPSSSVTHPSSSSAPSPEVVAFRDVTVKYGDRTILSDLSWTVHQGEHWVVYGPNGSGKSTLLSLVCADNPQGYACDISLFGHQRGSGESIWEIKKRIGYVSPEMHRSYHRDIPALRIVASGLKDTVGLYVHATEAEREVCRQCMRTFGIEHLADRSFLKMSSGEQRLVLLARAFVKNPDLLILDEPFHGLDDDNRQRVATIIENYCANPQHTLLFVSHYREEWPLCIDHQLNLGAV